VKTIKQLETEKAEFERQAKDIKENRPGNLIFKVHLNVTL
jgi:hypothetical protein